MVKHRLLLRMRTIVLQQYVVLIFALVLSSHRTSAQDPFSQADTNLNQAYKQALAKYTKPAQEPLRKAERAWIPFSDKDEAFLNALQRSNRLPEEFADAANILEVNSRAEHIRIFYCRDQVPFAGPEILQAQDGRLTSLYLDCMRRLSPDEQLLLKESERAWISYRDADAAAIRFAYTNDTIKNAAAAHLTALRSAQLVSLINSLKQGASPSTVVQPAPPPPAPDNTPNPEDVKAASQIQQDTKRVLNSLLKNKDTAFFKSADVVKNIPELPSDVAGQILELSSKFFALSRKADSQKTLAPLLNESATLDLLVKWIFFTQQLKSGDVAQAGKALQSAISQKPKDVSADYLPFWQTAESWQGVYAKAAIEFQAHVQKARTFAELGKNSDAIREYQAAFDIIENSNISKEIKKLREQSLGL